MERAPCTEAAGNAALEQQWLAQDLRAIAGKEGLDLRDEVQRNQAMDRLEAIHGKLGDVLSEARVLRAVEDVEREEPEGEDGARVHVNDPVMDRLVEERHGDDLKHSQTDGEKGITHG